MATTAPVLDRERAPDGLLPASGAGVLAHALCRLVDATERGVEALQAALLTEVETVTGASRSVNLVLTDGPAGTSLMPVALRGYPSRVFPKRGFRPDSAPWANLLRLEAAMWLADGSEYAGLRRMLGCPGLIAAVIPGPQQGLLLADFGRRSLIPDSTTTAAVAELVAATGRLLRLLSSQRSEADNLASHAVRALSSGLAATSQTGTVVLWNPRMETILGIASEDACGRPLERVVLLALETASAEPVLDAIEAARDSGVPMHLWQQGLTRTDGCAMTANLVAAPMSSSGMLLSIEDVTDRAALEGDMERMRHLAHLGQMTAQIAHELRNPLTSIRGAAQLLQQTEPDAPASEFARIILNEVDSLNRIAEDFLDFARPLQLRLQPVPLRDLLQDFVRVWRPVCRERGVTLRLNASRDLPILWIDVLRLNQVLRNLTLNACQAMPNGGTLTVSGTHDRVREVAVISVRDTGLGMTQEEAAHVFEPFFTTKAKGTGLGLAVVRKLVDAHGGTIELTSRPGKGSTFTLRLPARGDEP
ncbi:MAG: PAS domain S-box protein [Fimbriimonadia bacterium]|jgi:PAS domain S-box-containing protein